MRIAIVLAGLLLAAGCRAPLEGAPCPCLSGYECNSQNVCVLIAGGGPDIDAASQGDAGGDPDAAIPDASVDGGDIPDAADVPDSGGGERDASGGEPDASGGEPDASGGEPDASGAEDAAIAVWYEQE